MDHELAHSLVRSAYEHVARRVGGFVSREGQQQMVAEIADQLASARMDGDAPSGADVCVIEGGTGVGKTLGYLIPTITLAKQLKVRVLVSTATVALQEQLVSKDLPALSSVMPEPFTFGLIKGRGRYACISKLDRVLGSGQGDMLSDEPTLQDEAPQRTISLYQRLGGQLIKGAWSGDRDSLPGGIEDKDWARIAADRHACTGSACEHYRRCSYYSAKREISKADVIVANHDLVLSSLRSDAKALPDGTRAIYVFDEGHNLPSIALNHFFGNSEVSSRAWIPQLARALHNAGTVAADSGRDVALHLAETLEEYMAELERLCVSLYGDALSSRKGGVAPSSARVRLAHGQVPQALADCLSNTARASNSLLESCSALLSALKELRSSEPDKAPAINNHMIALGPLMRRLEALVEVCDLMLQDGPMPPAKWVTLEMRRGQVFLSLSASPMSAGPLLNRHLWSRLRAAVVTSATLRTLGRFDFFLRESGLKHVQRVRCVEVASPFDYAQQGKLVVVQTQASPKTADRHTEEVAQLLAEDLRQVRRGALVLCSSRSQLATIVAQMPEELRARALVQGAQSREALLTAHRRAVDAGLPSFLLGLHTFGEGLDLPGPLCEWVFVAKLPFMPPNDPVSEARAEWMEARGRSSFAEIVVPATGVTLQQWAGRGIRTEEDRATIVCYDPRLTATSFGRQLLGGLPPFRMVRRVHGRELAIGADRQAA